MSAYAHGLRERWRHLFTGRVRTPLVLQIEATECGAACLASVLRHFGCWVSLEEMREACAVSRDGCSAADIARAARQYGLETTGWKQEVGDLPGLSLPVILFWEFRHFVVLEGYREGTIPHQRSGPRPARDRRGRLRPRLYRRGHWNSSPASRFAARHRHRGCCAGCGPG